MIPCAVASGISEKTVKNNSPLIFERGFVSFDDVPAIRKEMMKAEAAKYGKRIPKEFMDDE